MKFLHNLFSSNTVKLPYIGPSLYLRRKIAIVGSSGKLNNVKSGHLIDSFEEVVRFNRAPSFGFEDHVGSKTTLRVVNNHVMANADIAHEDGGYSGQPKDFVKDLRNSKILYIGPDPLPWEKRKDHSHSSNSLYRYDFSTMEDLKKILGYSFPRSMTVGGTFIALCVKAGLCPKLFGFDLAPTSRTHYWETRPPEANNIHHNISEEQKMLIGLSEKGYLEIFP